MTRSHADRRRGPALAGGVVAMLALVATLVLWLTGRADAGRVVIGAAVGYAVVVALLVAVAAGTWLVRTRAAAGAGLGVLVALGITLVNVLLGVVALFLVFRREDSVDLGVAFLLAVALMASNLVAGQVMRELRARAR